MAGFFTAKKQNKKNYYLAHEDQYPDFTIPLFLPRSISPDLYWFQSPHMFSIYFSMLLCPCKT